MLECLSDILNLTDLKFIRQTLADEGFVDGKSTAGFRAKKVKKNEQLSSSFEGKEELNNLIISRLQSNAEFNRFAFPRKIRPPLFSRYKTGMEYGYHVDDALMGGRQKTRTDLSVTVFLNQPTDYTGGELEIETAFGPQLVKLPAGSAVVYPSSTLHRVAPVTDGERLVAVTWVQSLVKDPQKREMLQDLHKVRMKLNSVDKSSRETDLAFKTYANLLRMWTDT